MKDFWSFSCVNFLFTQRQQQQQQQENEGEEPAGEIKSRKLSNDTIEIEGAETTNFFTWAAGRRRNKQQIWIGSPWLLSTWTTRAVFHAKMNRERHVTRKANGAQGHRVVHQIFSSLLKAFLSFRTNFSHSAICRGSSALFRFHSPFRLLRIIRQFKVFPLFVFAFSLTRNFWCVYSLMWKCFPLQKGRR